MAPVTIAVIGAGSRGSGYARYAAEHPDQARIVAVAEPRNAYRERLAAQHSIPSQQVFTDWQDAAAAPKLADAVLICTQDAMHVGPALAFARAGYHILLEKPMATDEAGCRQIVAAVRQAGVQFAVAHVSRYTPYTQRLKAIIDAGAIGDLVCLQRLEPVGYWHQAHSFVRGNWRNEAESSFMLLAKSCHDLDWIRHIMGVPCQAVSSFGSLQHFRAEEAPEGAAQRCLDCGVEADCPYSARRYYLDKLASGHTGWPLDVLTPEPTVATVTAALREGPYGRCVYHCDNDVVDNQVVNLEFAGGRSASFTMTAFTEAAGRRTEIFGTRGHIRGDGQHLNVFDFLSNETQHIDTAATDASILGGHGGGDFGLMAGFLRAITEDDATHILSGPEETLETHLMVFAAERARHERRVVDVEV
ncbi:MAG: Gfo/Idh/MocA family oxidoreductase [bacterium]|nr:Gfo/Idh/MocA family oxidoreductase [bacterium]